MALTFSLVAMFLTVFRAWPQVRRIALHDDVSGVSALTWTVMLAVNSAWFAWGLYLGVVILVVSNIFTAIGNVAILLTMARHGLVSRWRPLIALITPGLVVVALSRLAGNQGVVTAILILTVFMMFPQLVRAYRTTTAGISAASWWMAIFSSIAWNTYYVLINKPILTLPNWVIIATSALIVARVHKAAHRLGSVAVDGA